MRRIPAAGLSRMCMVLLTCGACNAALLTLPYLVGAKVACVSGSLCTQLESSPLSHVLGIPLPVWGTVAYLLDAGLFATWSASPQASTGRFRAFFWFAGCIALASVGLYSYGHLVLDSTCGFCWLNSLISVGVLLCGNLLPSGEAPPVRFRPERALAVGAGLAAASVCLGSFLAIDSGRNQLSGTLGFDPPISDIVGKGRPQYGNPSSRTVVVLFSDPDCPACDEYVPWLIDQVQGPVEGRVRAIFRSYPLKRIHPGSESLALAEAWSQSAGCFEKVRTLILQGAKTEHDLLAQASRAGIDTQAMRKAMEGNDRAAELRLDEDVAAGNECALSGTPYFLIKAPGEPLRWALGSAIEGELSRLTR